MAKQPDLGILHTKVQQCRKISYGIASLCADIVTGD